MSDTYPGAATDQDPGGPEPRVGHKIGPYRLVKLLGQGSSGRVFEVEHSKIGRRAAMKTLSYEHAARPGAVKRLFAEALAVNRIDNPHIVEVTDLVEQGEHHLVQNGRESLSSLKVNALVMELLEGQSLAQAMVGEGPMPPDRFLPIMAQVAQALAAAHAAGFIHRDLKPENIFLVERGGHADFVKLLDFGLAKTVNIERDVISANPSLSTLDGTFLGTPAYTSPEQASGKVVDHRTDLYALGVILYELVVGHLPFEGESVGDFIIKHLTVAPPPLPDDILATKLGRTLDAIIKRCLEKEPAARFPSAAQLADMFDALGRGEPIQFTAMDTYADPGLRRRGARRTALRLAIGAGAGLALAGILFAAAGKMGRQVRRAEPPATPAAPPGSAAPAPPSGSGAAGEITITFESEPSGARARLVGHPEILGLTPFQRAFPRDDAGLVVEITHDGYEPLRVTIPTASSRTVNVALTRARSPAETLSPESSARRPRPTKVEPRRRLGNESEKTIDPFQ